MTFTFHPHARTFREFVSGLADRLRSGEQIGMHCRGSIGRAPTNRSMHAHSSWLEGEGALKAIQNARGFPIPDTDEQLRWILDYKAQP